MPPLHRRPERNAPPSIDHRSRSARPVVVVAVPIAAHLIERLRARQDITVLCDPTLLPPRRHVADYEGDPTFVRDAQAQRSYDALIDRADILFGIPDTDPAALRRTAAANPHLRWVHTMAAGGGAQIRAAGLSAERLAGIEVTTSAGVHGQALAEFALLGLLAGVKDLPRWQRDQRATHWPPRRPVRQVRDTTVLVLGTGGIGSEVARLLGPFGTTVWGLVKEHGGRAEGFARTVSTDDLSEVLPQVDALVCALPDTPRTRGLVDAEMLGRLAPGAIVINVGRGTVIDEGALVAALESGRVSFAALDVFEREPLPHDSPLWASDRVLVSPHTAALDDGEEERIVELFLDNLDRHLAGEPLRNAMDRAEFY